jgi:hypothetical protein
MSLDPMDHDMLDKHLSSIDGGIDYIGGRIAGIEEELSAIEETIRLGLKEIADALRIIAKLPPRNTENE